MNARLRVLVIGAGTMGSVHSRAYTRLPNAEVVGIVDPHNFNPSLAASLNVPQYRAVSDVAPQHFDVVDVSVPSRWHLSYVTEAALLGKSVFCEKPLALSLDDARAMLDVVERSNVRMSVGHCVRFFPEYVAAKAVIDEGQLGEIGVVRTFRGGAFPTAWNDWYANRDLSGGNLVDLMIHDFDFLRWVLGPVSRVYARTTRREMNRVDFSLATLRFASGAIAHLEGSWAHRQFGTRFEFAGSQGTLQYDSFQHNPLDIVSTGSTGVALPPSSGARSPYDLELAHFIDALANDQPFRVTPEDAYQAVQIALAAETSAMTGQAVSLDQTTISGGVA